MPMLREWAINRDLHVKYIGTLGLPPLLIHEGTETFLAPNQIGQLETAKNYVTSTTSAKTIFLSAYHSFYLSNPEYEQALSKTVSFLIDQQKDVCIFAQTPPLEPLLRRHLESTHLIKSIFPRHLKYSELFTFNQQYVEKKIAPMRAILHRLKARYPQIHIWHPEKYIKSSIYEGVPCYRDDNHLNLHGSLYFLPYFDYPF